MARRVHVDCLKAGESVLSEAQAHHVRDVLRAQAGQILEAFDNAGQVARATVVFAGANEVRIDIEPADIGSPALHGEGPEIIVASSIPKGGRADWMVEKLSELGAAALVPLTTARGVVKPAGDNKADRWRRIATESAKQSHRVGVMRIAAVSSVDDALASAVVDGESAVWMTPDENAASFADVMDERAGQKRVTIFIGPEGGWDEREAAGFRRGGAAAARFGRNILRTETAAITAAAWVALRRLKAE